MRTITHSIKPRLGGVVRLSLNTQIFLGAGLGVGLGLLFSKLGEESPGVKQGIYWCSLVGNLFIDLLKMVLVPPLRWEWQTCANIVSCIGFGYQPWYILC